MSKKVKHNIKQVHYAKITAIDSSTGAITYGTIKSHQGAKAISLEPQDGDSVIVYADGEEYYVENGSGSQAGELTMICLEDEFWKDILGEEEDDDGVLWENESQEMAEFALGFVIETTVKDIYFWYQRVAVTKKPKLEAATDEENKTFGEDVVPIKCKAGEGGYIRAKSGENTNTANWFSSVKTTPSITPEGGGSGAGGEDD